MFDFGKTLYDLRKKHGYTQQRVADILDVSVTTIGRWENNYKLPSASNLIDLASLYHVPLNYLVGIDKEKSVVTENLTPEQQDLINMIVLEFQSVEQNNKNVGLTIRQQEILVRLMQEFRLK